MIDISTAKNKMEELSLIMIKSFEYNLFPKAVEFLGTNNFCWLNSGMPPIKGKKALISHFVDGKGFARTIPILKTMSHFTSNIIHIASSDSAVFTERIDHHWDKYGSDLMPVHICGVIEFDGNKITALRDFFDVSCYNQSPSAVDPEFSYDAHQSRLALAGNPCYY